MTKKAKRPTRNDAATVLDGTQNQRKAKGSGNGSGTIWWDEAISRYRWQITLQTRAGGKRKTRNGRAVTKTGAREAMQAALVDHKRGDLQAPDTITVTQQAEIWLNRLTKAKPRTLALYRQELDYALRVIGQEKVQHVSTATLKDLVAALSRQEMAGGLGRGKPMSPRTHSKVVIRLRAVFDEAVSDGTIKVSPMNGVKRERAPKPGMDKDRVLEEPQLALFQALGTLLWRAGIFRLWPALFAAVSVGLRRGEVLGLAWTNVNFKKGVVQIRQQVIRTPGGARVSDMLKTDHARRDIHMPPSLMTLLQEHQAQQRAERSALNLPWAPNGLVFATDRGNVVHPDNVNRALSRLTDWSRKGVSTTPGHWWICYPELRAAIQALHADGSALPEIAPHDLRHTYATLALRRGVPLAVVSKRLGHGSVSITNDIYRHVLPSEDRAHVIDLFTPPEPQD